MSLEVSLQILLAFEILNIPATGMEAGGKGEPHTMRCSAAPSRCASIRW